MFLVDLDGPDSAFSATTTVTGDRVTVVVTGEVDMSTADAMYQAATRDNCPSATLDLRAVTFFDSAAIHAVIRLADLRLRQGRLEDAAELLRGLDRHPDAVRTLAALHLARGETALAELAMLRSETGTAVTLRRPLSRPLTPE